MPLEGQRLLDGQKDQDVLDRDRLGIDDDRLRRNALVALARDFRTLSPELEHLATSGR